VKRPRLSWSLIHDDHTKKLGSLTLVLVTKRSQQKKDKVRQVVKLKSHINLWLKVPLEASRD